jgi:hypothetical protein
MGRRISNGTGGATSNLLLAQQSDIRFGDADTSNYVAIQAPSTVSTNYTMTLPSAVSASNGFALTSDTGGTLSWASTAPSLTDESLDAGTNYLVFTSASSGNLTAARVATSNISYIPSTGVMTVNGLTITGTTTLQETTESLNVINSYGTSQSVAFSNGNVHQINGLSGNYTFNWTGVPTTNNRTFTLTHIIPQGATPRIPTTLQINSSPVTINWAGNVTPTGSANRQNIVSFLIWYTGSFTVVAALGSY